MSIYRTTLEKMEGSYILVKSFAVQSLVFGGALEKLAVHLENHDEVIRINSLWALMVSGWGNPITSLLFLFFRVLRRGVIMISSHARALAKDGSFRKLARQMARASKGS